MDKLSTTLLHCYLCLQSNTTCIPTPDKWSCLYCLSLGEGCIFIPPIPNDMAAVLLSRNCVECIVVTANANLLIRFPTNVHNAPRWTSSVTSSFLNMAVGMISTPKIIFIQRPPRIVAMSRILYPNYRIKMGDLSTRTRVFTITILSMVRAATVVLNRSPILILEE